MELDPNKSVIIFSHPRSGSTCIQDSLPQFNLVELFTMYCHIKSVDINKGIKYSYLSEPANDLDYRFELFDTFQRHHGAISVKVHLHLLTNQVCEFFRSKDLQYVLLKRRNNINTFWSLLIALNTLELHNTINTKSIIVSRQSFDDAIDIMSTCKNKIKDVKQQFNPTNIVYEDLMKEPASPTWNPSSKYIVQNAKNKIKIENIDEINQWIQCSSKYIHEFSC
jgi:hypothetical protein